MLNTSFLSKFHQQSFKILETELPFTFKDSPVEAFLTPSLLLSGKKTRPLFVFLCADLLHYRMQENVILIAKIIEYMHWASLFHDDVLDEAHLRRGQPCLHQKFGNKRAILCGDYVMSIILKKMLSLNNIASIKCIQKALSFLIQGQLQESLISFDTPLLVYLKMLEKKTAVLFVQSAALLLLFQKTSLEKAKTLLYFAKSFGIAFQILDDLHDYCPTAFFEGKSQRQDLKSQKITWPLLYLFQKVSDQEKKHILKFFKNQNFEGLLSYFIKYNVLEDSYLFALSKVNDSFEKLKMAYMNADQDALSGFSYFIEHVLGQFSFNNQSKCASH